MGARLREGLKLVPWNPYESFSMEHVGDSILDKSWEALQYTGGFRCWSITWVASVIWFSRSLTSSWRLLLPELQELESVWSEPRLSLLGQGEEGRADLPVMQ